MESISIDQIEEDNMAFGDKVRKNALFDLEGELIKLAELQQEARKHLAHVNGCITATQDLIDGIWRQSSEANRSQYIRFFGRL